MGGRPETSGKASGSVCDALNEALHVPLARVLELIPDAALVTDRDGVIRVVNAELEALSAHPPGALVGQSVDVLVPDGRRAEHARRRATYGEGPTRRRMGEGVELALQRRDGGRVPVVVSLMPLAEPAGWVLAAIRDVSALREAGKMEAVGRLAAGVAHDFNNVLTVILGYADACASALPEAHAVQPDLAELCAAARRAAGLTRQLLAFGRRRVSGGQAIDVGAFLRAREAMAPVLAGGAITLRLSVAGDLPLVEVDETELEQVLLNLVANARDALPRGGTITVDASALDHVAPDAEREADAAARAGRWLVLTVRDDGVGMDAETRAHAFEPFFTTKELGRGTGLGLASVFGIARQAGGFVRVASEPGLGATFEVHLPAARPEAVERPASRRAVRPAVTDQEPRTVLLVDDDPTVHRLLARALRRAGYRVLDARSSDEALALVRAHGRTVDLLVTDVVMPGLSGPELAVAARASHAGLRVLYVSGYSSAALVASGALEVAGRFLEKPMTIDAFLAAVHDALLDAPPDVLGAPA